MGRSLIQGVHRIPDRLNEAETSVPLTETTERHDE